MFFGFAYKSTLQNEGQVALSVLPKLSGKTERHHLGKFRDHIYHFCVYCSDLLPWSPERKPHLRETPRKRRFSSWSSLSATWSYYSFAVHSVWGRLRYCMEPVAGSDRGIPTEALRP